MVAYGFMIFGKNSRVNFNVEKYGFQRICGVLRQNTFSKTSKGTWKLFFVTLSRRDLIPC